MKKKALSLLLVSAMVFSLAACSSKSSGPSGESGGSSNPSPSQTGEPDSSDNEKVPSYTIAEFDPNATYTYNASAITLPVTMLAVSRLGQ